MNKGISTAACILVIFCILISFSGCKKINVREVVSSKDNADIQNELDDREKNDSRVDSLPHNSESNEQIIVGTDSVQIAFRGKEPLADFDYDNAVYGYDNAVALMVIPSIDRKFIIQTGTDGYVLLDEGNGHDFSDPNVVLHGEGSIIESFALLQNVLDPLVLEKNPYIYIYMKNRVMEYEIFAAYFHSPEDILVKYNCYDYTKFQNYINDVFLIRDMNSYVNDSMHEEVVNTWQLLTLQSSLTDGRCFIVQASMTGAKSLSP
ncbi:hypothetical protein [Butyrivibrio sp. NC3005]|jgi:hypothetical protein|uniref:hypothetical protein n=1 Tax=Butyrivibrio sp. NC3005 TaxID=1280685 RepID=UPI00041D8FAF|nr:hypothetical protein [Butyrivibrio sp. NC3005]